MKMDVRSRNGHHTLLARSCWQRDGLGIGAEAERRLQLDERYVVDERVLGVHRVDKDAPVVGRASVWGRKVAFCCHRARVRVGPVVPEASSPRHDTMPRAPDAAQTRHSPPWPIYLSATTLSCAMLPTSYSRRMTNAGAARSTRTSWLFRHRARFGNA